MNSRTYNMNLQHVLSIQSKTNIWSVVNFKTPRDLHEL